MALDSNRVVERLLGLNSGAFSGADLYCWPLVFPTIAGVMARSGKIAIEPAMDWLGDPDAVPVGDLEIAPEAAMGALTTVDYITRHYRRGHTLSASTVLEASRGGLDGRPIVDRAANLTQRVVYNQLELALANLTVNATTTPFSTTTLAALPGLGFGGLGTKWSVVTAEPLTDLRAMYDLIRNAGHGALPDTVVLSYDVARAMANNAEVRSYIGDASAGVASGNRALNESALIDVIKTTVEVDNVFILKQQRNTANLGQTLVSADFSTSTLWMGVRGDAAPVASSGGVSINPTAAAFVEFSPFEQFSETLTERRGEKVISGIIGAFNPVSLELGYNLSTIL